MENTDKLNELEVKRIELKKELDDLEQQIKDEEKKLSGCDGIYHTEVAIEADLKHKNISANCLGCGHIFLEPEEFTEYLKLLDPKLLLPF